MRAFMSNREMRPNSLRTIGQRFHGGGDLDTIQAPVTAEREAHRILAETEPELPSVTWFEDTHKLTAVTTAHRTFAQMRAGNTAEILADGLRAWLGEPCRCVQGIHWSPTRGYFHCNGIRPEGDYVCSHEGW